MDGINTLKLLPATHRPSDRRGPTGNKEGDPTRKCPPHRQDQELASSRPVGARLGAQQDEINPLNLCAASDLSPAAHCMACRGSGVRVSLAPSRKPRRCLGFLVLGAPYAEGQAHPGAPRYPCLAHDLAQDW